MREQRLFMIVVYMAVIAMLGLFLLPFSALGDDDDSSGGQGKKRLHSRLWRCRANLSAGRENLNVCKGDLGMCSEDLAAMDGQLGQVEGQLATCSGDLATCQDALAACPTEQGDGAPVADTGQTACYEEDGSNNWVQAEFCDDVAHKGQDGQLDTGVTPPDPRFTDMGDGTVKDELTGLVWLKDWGCAGNMNWVAALAFANDLHDANDLSNDCGLSDGSTAGAWRLPNRNELLSVVDISRFNPALTPIFVGVVGSYWSSSTFAGGFQSAWGLKPLDGSIQLLVKGSGFVAKPVAVRDSH